METEYYCPNCGEVHQREDACPPDLMADRVRDFTRAVDEARRRGAVRVRGPAMTWSAMNESLMHLCFTPRDDWRVIVGPDGINLWCLTWERMVHAEGKSGATDVHRA